MKRKILILPSWYPSDAGPVDGIFVQDQAVLLSTEYEVAALVPRVIDSRHILKRTAGPRSQLEQRSEVSVYRERGFFPWPGIGRGYYWAYWTAARRSFERICATFGKPELIHAHVILPAGWAAVKLGEQYKIPVVLTEHTSPFSAHLVDPLRRALVQNTLPKVDRLIGVSPVVASQIRNFVRNIEITVIGNLIQTDFFIPAREKTQAPFRFLCVALLSEQKGVVYLLQATQRLVQSGFRNFEVLIGGDGPDRVKLEHMADALGLSAHCRFLGLLNRDEVRTWMQQCDVFVLPSLHETFGVVLGEAMACGKPVLATRCGGPEFVVESGMGILVERANPQALADAMQRFLAREYAFDPCAIRQSVVRRFGEAAFLQNMARLYNQVWENWNR